MSLGEWVQVPLGDDPTHHRVETVLISKERLLEKANEVWKLQPDLGMKLMERASIERDGARIPVTISLVERLGL